jgi:hypothetical protein
MVLCVNVDSYLLYLRWPTWRHFLMLWSVYLHSSLSFGLPHNTYVLLSVCTVGNNGSHIGRLSGTV